MHPQAIAAFLEESVEGLRHRLPELDEPVPELRLDLEIPELIIEFEHSEYETEAVQAVSPFAGPGGQAIVALQRVPILGWPRRREHLMLRMNLERFDLVPPTAQLCDGDGQLLPFERWPRAWQDRGIVQEHCLYKRPFFCRPGLREFHTHPQHEDQPWAAYREIMPLHDIVVGLLSDLQHRFYGAA